MATPIWDGSAADNNPATAANWTPAAVPVSTDTVVIPAMAADSTKDIDGVDWSAKLFAEWTVEPNSYLNFADRMTPLHIDTDLFIYCGRGKAFYEIDNCADIRLLNGSPGSSGYSYGFELTGTGNTALLIDVGAANAVGIAANAGTTCACTTIDLYSGIIDLGDAVTMTTLNVFGGTVANGSDATTINVYAGTVTQQAGTATTLNLYGGRYYHMSSTQPTTINVHKGGILDLSRATTALTTGCTVNLYRGGQIIDPNDKIDEANAVVKPTGPGTIGMS